MSNRTARILAVISLIAIAVMLPACNNSEVQISEFEPEVVKITTTKAPTTTTNPAFSYYPPAVEVPATKLQIGNMQALMSSTLAWSTLKAYDHTIAADGSAVFAVSDGHGYDLMLTVVFDETADTVSVADLTFEDTTVSLLTEQKQRTLLQILKAQDDYYREKAGVTEGETAVTTLADIPVAEGEAVAE